MHKMLNKRKIFLCPKYIGTQGIRWSLWRNRLARSAVNRKVGGSSPPRDELETFFPIKRPSLEILKKTYCSKY